MKNLTAGILIIGNEIVDGIVLDTNGNWLAKMLRAFGVHVKEFMTIRDEIDEISKAIRRMIEDECDLIITSGGLGPTHDDKTLQGVAKAFNLKLTLNIDALKIIQRQYRYFYEKGYVKSPEITEPRKKMAILPEGAKPLDNRVGGAPGVLLETDNCVVISLPGVPRELKWIFENKVVPWLKERVKAAFYEEVFEVSAIDETTLSPFIDEVMREVPGVYIKSMPEVGKIRVWISASSEVLEDAKEKVKKAIELLEKKLST